MSGFDVLLHEARHGRWMAETDDLGDGDRRSDYSHGRGVWVINDRGDSLFVSPDDVAMLLNHALVATERVTAAWYAQDCPPDGPVLP